MQKRPSWPDQLAASRTVVLGLCFSLNLLFHLPFLNLPPQSRHVWRQCNTLAVARNFYEEDMNILRPRIDRRLDQSGVTGMQFPSYEYLVALGYGVFGEQNWVHRSVSFIIYCLGAWGTYELFLILFGSSWAAALGAWSFSWSPELFYFGISALPDVLALTASLWGLALFLRWFREGNRAWLALSWPLCVLAGLTKIQFLAVGFPMAALVLENRRKWTLTQWFFFGLYGLSCAGLVLAWYIHAVHLIQSTGLADFRLNFSPAHGWVEGIRTLWHNAHSEIPELILNYATSVFFLAGILILARGGGPRSEWFYPLVFWTVAVGAYYLIELSQMGVHSYYLLPLLPPLLIVAVKGALAMKDGRWRPVFLAVLLLQPVLAFFRIVPPRFWGGDKEVPVELYNEDSRMRLEKAAPNDALCVVGSDHTGCVYLYFLHKKGFGFGFSLDEDLMKTAEGKPLLAQYIRRGARYLYTDDPQLPASPVLKPYLGPEVLKEGNFQVFKLKEIPPG